ncbi:MAG: Disulfide bond formation protein DsbB [Candidatus Midichloria mitochondrii]|uniref:Disulfide bond formation protein n=1 Tax=Midichloria mitochondrii (strain IricVA) TaxID=696127 RepID=F7XWC9_MIDMI|nr:disulfide bond formation protein B [Candidatus Midichloria mitochondrii]AEI88978.1 disulfide bond formation protein [Candidatus Midichloria mitochondrii IricVA]MDJ1255977.1 disulfide bond formation protein B [Candidatus Midichloria mitochondrii]MDJ1287981.1 disulfide bond formation protein B [Candidatus Midichloria mitochondrii]MDJ1298506.1 disulfide bond formation protein B [Candidatus Midichloria mitochondrii]MDJ1312657.1 disulfide bond formation protein B [Candidatus Midichloria mitochon
MCKHYFHLLLIISILALSGAYIGEFFLGILPCRLCYYQRYVYFALLSFSLIFILKPNINKIISLLTTFLILFTGFIISFFHSGVERHWFKYNSVCTGFSEPINSAEQIVRNIEDASIAVCDILGPQLLGLTMANWNALLLGFLCCVTLFIYCKDQK